MLTAYGDPAAKPTADDLVEYLDWCREMKAVIRMGRAD